MHEAATFSVLTLVQMSALMQLSALRLAHCGWLRSGCGVLTLLPALRALHLGSNGRMPGCLGQLTALEELVRVGCRETGKEVFWVAAVRGVHGLPVHCVRTLSWLTWLLMGSAFVAAWTCGIPPKHAMLHM